MGWDGMGWDGYLLGPTLRAPYGANKFIKALVIINYFVLKFQICTDCGFHLDVLKRMLLRWIPAQHNT